MISYLPAFALTFALGLIVSLAVTPMARRLGEHRDIADRPGGRRQHRGVIPRLGGIALYAGFTVAVLATILLPQRIFPPSLDPKETRRLIGVLIGTTAVFIFGLLDDRYEFPSRPQYIAQFLSALIALAFIIFIMIKQMNRLKREAPAAPAEPPPTPEDVLLLREIRDSLKK